MIRPHIDITMRLVYEGGNELPLRMMRELLADLDHAIEQGENCKFKVRIDVEYLRKKEDEHWDDRC